MSFAASAFYLAFEGAVEAPRIDLLVLDEIVVGDMLAELFVGKKPVVDSVGLSVAGRTVCGRYGELHIDFALL